MPKVSGYSDCPCRDCFDIAMDGDLCLDCEEAGCEVWPGEGLEVRGTSYECQVTKYGVEDDTQRVHRDRPDAKGSIAWTWPGQVMCWYGGRF